MQDYNLENNPMTATTPNGQDSRSRKRTSLQSHLDATEIKINKSENRYTNASKAPFTVLITYSNGKEDQNETKKKNIGNLHPMDVGRALRNKDSAIKRIDRKGANLIQVTYDNPLEANNLVEYQETWLPENWIAYIPDYKTTRIGVGKGIKTTLTEKLIREGLSWDHHPIEIIKMERFTRPPPRNCPLNNSERTPTETIKFVFKGERLPTQLKIFKTIIKIVPFEPRIKQCRKCQRLGHLEKQCRGKKRCPICAEEHGEEDCDKAKIHCANCREQHKATDQNCRSKIYTRITNKISAHLNIDRKEAQKIIKREGLITLEETSKWLKRQPRGEDNWIFPNNHTIAAWLPPTWSNSNFQGSNGKIQQRSKPQNNSKRNFETRRKIRKIEKTTDDNEPPDFSSPESWTEESSNQEEEASEKQTQYYTNTQQTPILVLTTNGVEETNFVAVELNQFTQDQITAFDSTNNQLMNQDKQEALSVLSTEISQTQKINEIPNSIVGDYHSHPTETIAQ
ncbi:uncharacterized protein LOC130669342 [Microplitis mediator]|uniref:uncharacterized protein LOC130669342 n=1 Tax=Microplitis mediator TaxID=375433 RepID=UPI002555FFF6|nr:uncharacterized protein LOC130669342 [Microplitis mediator]